MYVRLDKVSASAHLEAIVATEDLENGVFLALGDAQEDGELRLATPSGDQTKELVFHASVPLMYEDDKDELDFVLKAGKRGRGFVVEEGMIVSLPAERIAGVKEKDVLVIDEATGELKVHDGLEEATGLRGTVIAMEQEYTVGELAVIRFRK